MPLYAPAAPAVVPDGQADCPCVACRFGHGRRHPARSRRCTSDTTDTMDTTDAEWQVVAAVLPWPAWPDGNGGRPEEYCRRLIVEAIFYVADNGDKRRNLPGDFPAWRTVHTISTRWWQDGSLDAVHNDLREEVRRSEGRDTDPAAAIIDSQSVRAAGRSAPTAAGTTRARRRQAASAT